MRRTPRFRNPFSFLFAQSRVEQYLTRYIVREHARGRPLEEIMGDAYIRNRSTPEQRARLLERPEVIAALGAHIAAGDAAPTGA